MFGKPLFFASQHVRAGGAQLFSEFVATFGLLAVIWGTSRSRPTAMPFAVGRLHHGRVLVHGLDVVRQPGGDARPRGQRHVRGHSSRRRARLHRALRSSGAAGRHAALSMAGPEGAGRPPLPGDVVVRLRHGARGDP